MENDTLNQMIKDFNSDEEKEFFMESQHKQIIILSQEIKDLKQENVQLKIDLTNKDKPSIEFKTLDPNFTSEEVICLTQIELLKNMSLERELTKEEVQKLEILSKVLTNVRIRVLKANGQSEMDELEVMSDEELEKAMSEIEA